MSMFMPKPQPLPPPPTPETPAPPPTIADASQFNSQRNMLRRMMTSRENPTQANTATKTLLGQ